MKSNSLVMSGFNLAVILILISLPAHFTFAANINSLTKDEAEKIGERMYREGVLRSGEPMPALVKGDIPAPGTSFTCSSCHLRAGIGSIEGGVYTPPTNGRNLYQPLKKIHKGVEVKYGEAPFRRPAYTDETLGELIRSGIDPSGKVINEIMPRYLLENDDAKLLVDYLKNLSVKFSPGVTDTELSFATVYSEDVPTGDLAAMLKGIEKYIYDKNSFAKNYRTIRNQRDRMMAQAMSTSKELESRKLTLAKWVLKGARETWRAQLEAYNRKEPVFAILGGLVSGEWLPVHQFSEENRIPCIFPNTELPFVSGTDWYTLYISKGYFQEGETVARYINSREDLLKDRAVLQIVRDTEEGNALAKGFEQAWKAAGNNPLLTYRLKKGEPLTEEFLDKIMKGGSHDVVLLWDALTEFKPIENAFHKLRPQALFLSSRYLGRETFRIPEKIRDFTYMTYPYRLPQDKVIEPMMGGTIKFQVEDNKVAQNTYALTQLLSMAVMEMKNNYYRDNLLDVIGMSMDRIVPLYERLSFGPGQRYASKGCYIVQLGKGEKGELIGKSDWVIH